MRSRDVRNVIGKYGDSMSIGCSIALSKIGVTTTPGSMIGDPDAERRDLGGEHLAHGLGRPLRRRVGALARRRRSDPRSR